MRFSQMVAFFYGANQEIAAKKSLKLAQFFLLQQNKKCNGK